MKTTLRLLFVALFGIAMSFGGTIIDTFDTPQGLVSDSNADGIMASSTAGNRTIWTNMTGGVGSTSIQINNGFYLGNVGSLAIGDTGVVYTGLWDLTEAKASALTLDVLGIEKYDSGSITFFIMQGPKTATYTMTVPTPGPLSVALSGFTGIDSVNRALIDSLGFTFSHVMAQDIVLDNFGTHVVPEPASYALMACGLLGLALVRRRRL